MTTQKDNTNLPSVNCTRSQRVIWLFTWNNGWAYEYFMLSFAWDDGWDYVR